MGTQSRAKTSRISSVHFLPSTLSAFSCSVFLPFYLFLSHGSDIEAVALSSAPPLFFIPVGTGSDVVEEELLCLGWWSGWRGAGAGDPENHDIHRSKQRPEQRARTEQLLPQQCPTGQLGKLTSTDHL